MRTKAIRGVADHASRHACQRNFDSQVFSKYKTFDGFPQPTLEHLANI